QGLRPQLPGDLPRDRQRLLAAGADRLRRRSLPAREGTGAERDAGEEGGGQERHPGRLVLGLDRPRLVQELVGPLGRAARAEQLGGADPSEPARDAGRLRRARRRGRLRSMADYTIRNLREVENSAPKFG